MIVIARLERRTVLVLSVAAPPSSDADPRARFLTWNSTVPLGVPPPGDDGSIRAVKPTETTFFLRKTGC